MIDIVAKDPALLMAAVAAVGLAVLLRRLKHPRREARTDYIREQARHEFGLEVLEHLRSVDPVTVDLEPPKPIDLRESLDLTAEGDPEPDDTVNAAETDEADRD